MKIIHTGDIHIGSAFVGLSAEKAALRRRELLENFRSVCEYAKAQQVSAVLIAGDLFDENTVSLRLQEQTLEWIAAAAPVCFFYVSGNHDKAMCLQGGALQRKLPQNLFLFTDDRGWKSYDLGEEISITGADSTRFGVAFSGVPDLPREKFNIVLLHGQITQGVAKNKEDIALPLLQNKNIDYLALGHIHKPMLACERLDGRGVYRYCGCLEGRGFDETGDRGFFLLDVRGGRIADERFLSFATRKVEEVRLDISACRSYFDLERLAQQATAGVAKNNVLKLTLCGRYSVSFKKELAQLQARLSQTFFQVKIADASKMAIDVSLYEYDKTERGEFVKEVGRYAMNEDFRAEVLEIGLLALAGEEIEI